ncbi:MAG: UxaA family hydrolase [Phycisphaeraceae bacterium]
MPTRCFRIHPQDNVATLLDDGSPGPAEVLGHTGPDRLDLVETIELGHKVALYDIAEGEAIVKYGVSIGRATAAIAAGRWVHLHNCTSRFDERSQTLDVRTGATTDTRYE